MALPPSAPSHGARHAELSLVARTGRQPHGVHASGPNTACRLLQPTRPADTPASFDPSLRCRLATAPNAVGGDRFEGVRPLSSYPRTRPRHPRREYDSEPRDDTSPHSCTHPPRRTTKDATTKRRPVHTSGAFLRCNRFACAHECSCSITHAIAQKEAPFRPSASGLLDGRIRHRELDVPATQTTCTV